MQPLLEPRRGVAEVGEERDDPEADVECDGIEDRPVAGECLEQVNNPCPAAQAVGHQDQYDAEHGSAENVTRVVEPEIDPHEVDDGCAQDGEPARGSIREKDRHGQSEENRGVVAWERRPVVQRVRIDAERDLEVQGGIVQRTQVGGQSELYAAAEHACEERCEHADEDSGADLDMGVLEPDVPDEREQRQVGEHVALDGPDAVVEDKETAREPVDGMQEEVVRTVPAKYHSEVVSRKMDEAARRMMRRRRCSTRCAEVTASDGARALKTVLVDTHPLLWIESPMRRSLWIIAYRARSVDTSFKR